MAQVTVVIPNFNGCAFLPGVLSSLEDQTFQDFTVLVVDNGSTDQSLTYIAAHFPAVKTIALDDNYGFSYAVNMGIRASDSPYVILLNNDTEADSGFVAELLASMKRHEKAFACAARMIQFYDREKLDGAGDFYCALGWAYPRGRGKAVDSYEKEEQVFSCCGGAAIYRRDCFEQIGYFDNEHFAYLEDLDIGYRARIYGLENWYAPKARVYHVGSGTSGSRYNQFKTRYSSRNNIYLIYKNMPWFQILLNLPFLAVGFAIKLLFFAIKGTGREYLAGIYNGFQICRREAKVPFQFSHLGRYARIQWELWRNMVLRIVP